MLWLILIVAYLLVGAMFGIRYVLNYNSFNHPEGFIIVTGTMICWFPILLYEFYRFVTKGY